jgi:hypothetical protein
MRFCGEPRDDGVVKSRKTPICHCEPFDRPFDFAQGHEQGRMAQDKADRRIFPLQKEIPLFARDSALHWIAAALRASQ